jgi:hypothetical protein
VIRFTIDAPLTSAPPGASEHLADRVPDDRGSSEGGTFAGLIDTSALLARSSSADLGYYGAFVLDPDGHNIEVVNHNR